MEILNVKTTERNEFVDITFNIENVLKSKKIDSGIVNVFCPHTTAALTINENADFCVKEDIIKHLKKIIPQDKEFTHCEGNSDSHIKASIFGSSLSLIIEKGKIALGTWQSVYFCEFDGPRTRKVYIKTIKG